MEKCTISFQLDGNLPLATVISMREFSIQSGDPNQSNNVTFSDIRPVRLLSSIALLILSGFSLALWLPDYIFRVIAGYTLQSLCPRHGSPAFGRSLALIDRRFADTAGLVI